MIEFKRSRTIGGFIGLVGFLLGAGSLPLAAQDRTYTIRGVVRDTALRPIAGAEVISLSRGRRSTTTDQAGRFVLSEIPEGNRPLLVRRIGFLPVHPTVKVPQGPQDSLNVILLGAPVMLPPLIVQADRPGIRGVVGDTAYHALPGTLVELLGARIADTTDEHGRFAFENLKQGQYVLRASRVGYVARLFSVDLSKHGQEYSIFLDEYKPGRLDWANTMEAANALTDLATRLSTEPRRYRMTRAELERYGSTALCDIARLRFGRSRPGQDTDPNILWRGVTWIKNASLCGWSADDLDLVEWGLDPCTEAAKTIADVMHVYCSGGRAQSIYSTPQSMAMMGRGPWVALWPRN
jgi:hypothetical protein